MKNNKKQLEFITVIYGIILLTLTLTLSFKTKSKNNFFKIKNEVKKTKGTINYISKDTFWYEYKIFDSYCPLIEKPRYKTKKVMVITNP